MNVKNGWMRRATLCLPMLVLFGAVLLAGCKNSQPAADSSKTTPPAAPRKEEPQTPATAPDRPAIAHPHPEGGAEPAAEPETPAAVAPADPDLGGILAKAEEERRAAKELAQKYYEIGQRLFAQSDFRAARDNFEHAVSLDPDNVDARRMHDEAGMMLGLRGPAITTVKGHYEERLRVQIEQVTMEIRNHLIQGKRQFDSGQYKEAMVEFDAVEEKLRWSPPELGLAEERKQAEEWKRSAADKLAVQQQDWDHQQKEAALKIAQKEEEHRRQQGRDKIKALFREALVNMDEQNYQRAEDLADEILRLDAKFGLAKEMKGDAIRARHRKSYKDFLRVKIERWKRSFEEITEANTPFAEDVLVRYPDSERWKAKEERVSVGQLQKEEAVDPDVLTIRNKLQTLKIDLDFTDASLFDILEFIREFAQINIEIAPEVKSEGTADKRITFQMKELVLENVLKLLLRQYGLDYTFENKILLITKPELAQGKPVLEVHDVRDLLRTIPDFPAPEIQLSTGDGDAGVSAAFAEPEERATITAEALQDLIKQNVSPASWEERQEEVSIALTGNGQLLVVHTPVVQEQIRDFLSELRTFTGAMVSIEARFVRVRDGFLQDVGVEVRDSIDNLEPVNAISPGTFGVTPFITNFNNISVQNYARGFIINNNKGGGATIDDEGVLIPGSGANSALNPFAGLRGEGVNGGNFDMRFRTAYSFLNGSKGFSQDFPIGARGLANQGGLGLHFRLLQDYELNLVIRALEKTQKGTVVTAPRVTAFNTQRAHILVADQQAYIKDYDVEIATNSVAFDPIVGIVQSGLALDVRPIISNDRRYLTLELRPAVAALALPIRTTLVASTFDAFGILHQVFIQLPELNLQQAQTTIRMPDKGSVIIAGLKNVLDRDISSETPFLARIPLLNFLFSRKGKEIDKNNLIILISAEIIDLEEREDNL